MRLIGNKSPQNNQASGWLAQLSVRQLLRAFIVLLILSGGAGLVWHWQTARPALLTKTAEIGLAVRHIDIEGRSHTSDADLLDALNIWRGMPILGLDLAAMRARVADIGWVAEARIERHLPDRLKIILSERIPVGLLQSGAGHQLIDHSGAIIAGADVTLFGHLPVVSGKQAASEAGFILDTLRTEPELYNDVWAIQRIAGRRWDVHLRNGITVKLPEQDPAAAWSRLARLQREKGIIERDLAAIDLRIPDQLVVEPNIPVRGPGQKT